MKVNIMALFVASTAVFVLSAIWAFPGAAKDGKDGAVKMIRKKPFATLEEAAGMGDKLWVDTRLGKSGKSCSTCHPDGEKLKGDRYPRRIEMAGDVLTLDQMINFCMKNPMQAKPLKWNSMELTALAAYVKTHTSMGGAMKTPSM